MFYTVIPNMTMDQIEEYIKEGRPFYYREADLPYVDTPVLMYPSKHHLGEVNPDIAI